MVMGMHRFLAACIDNLALRPMARRLLVIALAGLTGAAALAAAGNPLIAQLIGGLALVPLSVAAYLMLLPVWSDAGAGDWGPGPSDDDPEGPRPDHHPDGGLDWMAFERDFWAYVERERHAVAA
jgi:hypothetical protein